ncbi:MAG: asparagine synthase (glutamine-hydrolyzing) [Planctomycetales bacterium]|nr:asparagine synthase (glutamine-hydrolyzing) [Planctomycetales bacterium]
MCGIAGILNFTGQTPSAASIGAMTSALRHRGPDGEGFLRRDAVALGHRRLSIIDLEGGAQPLSNETGSVWLTFNGEIYNFQELRATLETAGHTFRSASDSEVIVHAYEEWGDDCVQRLRGMFAFGIADFDRRRLLLARDHFGIKPLFYRVTSEYIAFASELSSMLETEAARPPINVQALDYYLRYRYVPAPATIYDGILRLPAAHVWSCTFEGAARPARSYYQLRIDPDESMDDDTVIDQFAEVLDESVAAHLCSDVPFGAFLSGGVDSTLIVSAMKRKLDSPVKAFSIGFDEDEYSELAYAQQAARTLGVELHTEIVRPNVVSIFRELFERYGEPFADTSAVPTWCVSRLAREHVTMVLSGDGADEAFAGYQRYGNWLSDSLSADLLRIHRQPKKAFRRSWQAISGTEATRIDRWQQQYIGVFRPLQRQQLWREDLRDVVTVPCGAFTSADRDGRRLADLEYAQYVDIRTYLPGDILTKIDVATMCHGLEARTPFTDLKVMEFAARLPSRWRRSGSGHTADLKVLPKRLLDRQFPSNFVRRRKQGFAIPETKWLAKGTPVRRCFDDVVTSHTAVVRDYFEGRELDRMIRSFDERGTNATGLWLLFVMGIWFDQSQTAACRVAA